MADPHDPIEVVALFLGDALVSSDAVRRGRDTALLWEGILAALTHHAQRPPTVDGQLATLRGRLSRGEITEVVYAKKRARLRASKLLASEGLRASVR